MRSILVVMMMILTWNISAMEKMSLTSFEVGEVLLVVALLLLTLLLLC